MNLKAQDFDLIFILNGNQTLRHRGLALKLSETLKLLPRAAQTVSMGGGYVCERRLKYLTSNISALAKHLVQVQIFRSVSKAIKIIEY